jgi:YjjW family glycine radical enzyme activase
MSSIRGLVADTVSFSCVDGPGNRFVVFLQGCNFDCVACHNPYTINVCNNCGECVTACSWTALSVTPGGKLEWNESRCHGDDACIAACPIDATPKARQMTVGGLVSLIRRAAPFLSGITVSGGEATQQASFVRALFTAVKQDDELRRLTCFVDTNGSADSNTWDDLLPVMDGAMVDLKCFDPEIHHRMTGQPNDRVLGSIRQLQRANRLHEVRMLLVPGVNDDPGLLLCTAKWLASVDPAMRVKLIGFRCHGVRPTVPELVEANIAGMAAAAAVFADVGRFSISVV